LSENGQKIIAALGYINLKGECELPAAKQPVVPYSGTGSNESTQAGNINYSMYICDPLHRTMNGVDNVQLLFTWNKDNPRVVDYKNNYGYLYCTGCYPVMSGLVNVDLQNKINVLLKQYTSELDKNVPALIRTIDLPQTAEPLKGNTITDGTILLPYNLECIIRNGYISITISLCYEHPQFGYIDNFFDYRTCTFDLRTGQQITDFSQLFYKDADYVPYVNTTVKAELDKLGSRLKRPWEGLDKDGFDFTVNSIILKDTGAYSNGNTVLYIPFDETKFAPASFVDNSKFFAGYIKPYIVFNSAVSTERTGDDRKSYCTFSNEDLKGFITPEMQTKFNEFSKSLMKEKLLPFQLVGYKNIDKLTEEQLCNSYVRMEYFPIGILEVDKGDSPQTFDTFYYNAETLKPITRINELADTVFMPSWKEKSEFIVKNTKTDKEEKISYAEFEKATAKDNTMFYVMENDEKGRFVVQVLLYDNSGKEGDRRYVMSVEKECLR
jgi:hypothetical protein